MVQKYKVSYDYLIKRKEYMEKKKLEKGKDVPIPAPRLKTDLKKSFLLKKRDLLTSIKLN